MNPVPSEMPPPLSQGIAPPGPPPAVPVVAALGTPSAASPRTIRVIELLLLLAVAFGTSLYQAVGQLAGVRLTGSSVSQAWLFGLVHEMTGLALCAYLLHKQGRSFRRLGLMMRLYDPCYGIGIMILGLVATLGVTGILYQTGLYSPADQAAHASVVSRMLSPHFGWDVTIFMVVNAFFEELIVRAYLMTDLVFLTGSTFLAVIGSAVFQGFYHLYQGWQTALSVTAGFLVFSLFYVWSRRITPIIIAHMLWDLCMFASYIYWPKPHSY